MRAIILIASLSLLVLTGCVHTHHGHWSYDDRPRYSKTYSNNKHYKQQKHPGVKHHYAKKRPPAQAKKRPLVNSKKHHSINPKHRHVADTRRHHHRHR